jgi:hypothetical protein
VRASASDTLSVPEWLPPPVHSRVLLLEKLLAGVESDLTILHRLATDDRMLYVWRELARRKATDRALVEYFNLAFQRARFPHFVSTPKDRAALAAPWSSAAELCRWSNENQIEARMHPDLSAALVRVAHYFEEIARREGRLDSPLVVRHHSAHSHGRAYVRILGGLTRKLFGTALHRTVATTASVALQQNIDEGQVREWLKR